MGAGATYLALTSTVGCELLERTQKVEPLRTPTVRPLRARKVWPLPGASPASSKGVWAFRSRPDLEPAVVSVTARAHDTAAGYIFVATKNGPGEDGIGQDGPCILDDSGQVVWFRPTRGERVRSIDFKV